MELKKSPQADLDRNKSLFTLIGLVVVLGIVLTAFEYRASNDNIASLGELGDMAIEEEITPITRQEEIKPPPPPKPQVVEILEIVEDDVEIEDELEIEDSEADETTEVEVVEIEEEESDEVFQFAVIEDKPEFPGGMEALQKYLGSNTKFPEIAKENNIQGRVFVKFVIDKKGKVTDVEIARGVDPYLDKEALRVVKSMPDWAPGKQRGKPVKVSYIVPINFKLF
ncbi:MAG: energy transducer TonB [Bacteroidales bacterium]|nr:energy transducer TonB [Bacteroidales bacterium]